MTNNSDLLELDGGAAAVSSTPAQPLRAGMTTRVVRGSLWNIGGQAAALVATLVATPFVIRLLGSELYGLLALINVIVGYLSFADMGMGWASTRFASDAHARNDDRGEATVVWTALLMALGPALVFAAALALGARPLVEGLLRLPVHLHGIAIVALRIAAIGFVARAIAGVMNTPEFVRLRMDLAVLINSGILVAQVFLVPVVLLYGAGLPGAVTVIAGSGLIIAMLHTLAGMRLLPALRRPRVDLKLLKPLARFGGGVVITALATMALGSIDRVLLSRYASVQAVAYYAVAFNLSFMLTQAPMAMTQALLPAFSQLQANPDRQPLRELYWRALRGTLLWVAPTAVFICVIARPFFTLWAGPEFGRESTPLMYLLAAGFVFEAMAYVPFTLLVALGRTDLVAKCHGAVLIPYLIVAALAIRSYGAAGAAVVWSLRAIVSLVVFAVVASRISGFRFAVFPRRFGAYIASMLALTIPVLLICWVSSSPFVRVGFGGLMLGIHGMLVITQVLAPEERAWVLSKLPSGIAQKFGARF